MIFKIIICIVVGYVFGCFQTGYFYGKLNGVDIRKHGSGNSGATNTLRVLGKKAGVITYLGDALKAVAAILITRFLLFPSVESAELIKMYTGLGVVLGHNYPFYLKFKGGKGIATTSAVMVCLKPFFFIPGFIVFFGVFAITRYVSVASLSLSAACVIMVAIAFPGNWHLLILSLIFCVLAFWRHRENIKRLINGTENGFGKK